MAGARGTWNSRFGFIMAAVGSAVGLGNLVRFPREMAGQGGAAFLLVYLLLLLLVGLPAILGEMSLGKLTNSSPVNAFKKLAKDAKISQKWALLGIFGMLAATFVLFFYTVIAGWALRYFFESFWGGWQNNPTGLFASVETGLWAIIFNLIVTTITIAIVAKGISGGIEKAAVLMMPALFAIVVGVAIFAGIKDLMSGAEGLKAVWQPKWDDLGINHISKATGQVFFSLSLGQGAMLTYASYMEKKQSVSQDGTIIAAADTGVAILAAMMVFPILGFTGLLTSTDPEIQSAIGGTFGTAFIAMPNAFVSMGSVLGSIIGTVFFLGLFFAALSSAISLLEVPVSVLIDNLQIPRAKAALLVGLVTYTFGVLSASSSTWLVLFDEIAVNLFIVVGVAATTAFAGWYVKKMQTELDKGVGGFAKKINFSLVMVWMMRTVTPALIIITFVFGGLWGVDANGAISFWHDGHVDGGTSANWRELGHTFKQAFNPGGH